uniref:Uncharacterized protein n=1 Tax=Anguilla anguilla TaxID=7936 RepID=A0A0E9XD64_ANGAN
MQARFLCTVFGRMAQTDVCSTHKSQWSLQCFSTHAHTVTVSSKKKSFEKLCCSELRHHI